MIEIIEIARQKLNGNIGMFTEIEGYSKNFFGTPLEIIRRAEKYLNLAFPKDYVHFVEEYGNLMVGSKWVYGILDDNFESYTIADGVRATINARKHFDFPSNYYVIADEEGDEFHCIDCATKRGLVLAWETHNESSRESLANNFSEYLEVCILKT